jgi:hypothetical protein
VRIRRLTYEDGAAPLYACHGTEKLVMSLRISRFANDVELVGPRDAENVTLFAARLVTEKADTYSPSSD